jgi:hypothetical protein
MQTVRCLGIGVAALLLVALPLSSGGEAKRAGVTI